MTTTTRIRIVRTGKWVSGQRLATGDNVEDSVIVDVDPAELSLESRAALLALGAGKYQERIQDLHFNRDYEIGSCSRFGAIQFVADSIKPTTEEIDGAIKTAVTQLESRKTQELEKRSGRELEDLKRKVAHLEEAQKRLVDQRYERSEQFDKMAKRIRKLLKNEA